jgi:hypothetical protein
VKHGTKSTLCCTVDGCWNWADGPDGLCCDCRPERSRADEESAAYVAKKVSQIGAQFLGRRSYK